MQLCQCMCFGEKCLEWWRESLIGLKNTFLLVDIVFHRNSDFNPNCFNMRSLFVNLLIVGFAKSAIADACERNACIKGTAALFN